MYQDLGGVKDMESDIKPIKLKILDKLDPDLDARPYDKAFYHLLLDTSEDDDLILVGKNIFRKDQKHPFIDEIVTNHRLVAQLLQIQ